MFRYGVLLLLLITCCNCLPADEETSRQKRVIGGTAYNKGDYPFHVSFWYIGYNAVNNSGLFHYCGGSLIAEQWVITAGQCFEDDIKPGLGDTSLWRVYLGVHAQRDAEKDAQFHEIEKVIYPPEYNLAIIHGDLALVKLKTPATLIDGVVSLAVLNTDDECPSRKDSIKVIGWGDDGNKKVSNIPNVATLEQPTKAKCIKAFSDKDILDVLGVKRVLIDDKTLCANYFNGGRDACTNDAGSPLLASCGGKDNVVVGTVSYGYRCAEPRIPSVYTRVSAYRDWIQTTMIDDC